MLNKVIEIQNLSSGYGNKTIVKDLSFDVFENDFLCITGPNGGGKTTLIKTLLGLLPAQKGIIRFFRNGENAISINMGYLPQISLIDRKFPISVDDVILFGLTKGNEWKSSFSENDRQKVFEVIDLMGLKGLEKYSIGELSGGQLQRVLFARAIISSPEVLVLDEPDSYMDKAFRDQLNSILQDLNQHSAIIIVSHQENDFKPLIKNTLHIDRE